LSEWIAISLEQRCGISKTQQTEAEKELARQRFRRQAGTINLALSTWDIQQEPTMKALMLT